METTSRKLPFGFYVCALSFTFERLAYYTAKYGMAIFPVLAVAKGGLGLTHAEGALLSSWFVAFTYITPVIGGIVADRWISPRILVPVGEILMGLGYLVAWQATGKGSLLLCILLVAIGTGFFKGNVSGINGRQFTDEQMLNKVFSLQYSFVNIGSFLGTTFLVLVGTTYGYRAMFLVCGLFLFLDTAWWLFGVRFLLNDAGKKPFLNNSAVVDTVEKAVEKSPLTRSEKKRVTAILIVTIFSGIFWLFWYMVYMPVYYNFGPVEQGGKGWANWAIGNWTMPTSWFDSVNALCCIVLGPILAGVWLRLARRPKGDMSMYKKTGLGCGLLGLAYFVMVIADKIAGDKGQCSIFWVALVCVTMSVGEMVFSPLGNSFINKLAPAKVLGLLLGIWPIAVFFSQFIYPKIYAWSLTQNFGFAYGLLGAIVIVFGVILWAISGKLDSWADEE